MLVTKTNRLELRRSSDLSQHVLDFYMGDGVHYTTNYYYFFFYYNPSLNYILLQHNTDAKAQSQTTFPSLYPALTLHLPQMHSLVLSFLFP